MAVRGQKNEVVETAPIETTASIEIKQPVKKRVVSRDEWVTIMNYTTGTVLFNSQKTGYSLVFTEFGQTDQIQVSDLITIKNAYARYLREPWIIILDNDCVEFLGLSALYENIVSVDEMENLFTLPVDKMEEILKKAPVGMIQTVVGIAVKKIESGELDSISTIRMLEKVCGIELQDR